MGRVRESQRESKTVTKNQRESERVRESQREPERVRQSQRESERVRESHREPERERERERVRKGQRGQFNKEILNTSTGNQLMELMTKWHELYKLCNSRAVFSCSKAFKGR